MKKIQTKTITETVHIEDPSRIRIVDEMLKLKDEGFTCSNPGTDVLWYENKLQKVYFSKAKKESVIEMTILNTDKEHNTSEKEAFVIKPLFATADKNGHYIDVSPDITECHEWLKENDNKEAKTIIGGYGIFNANTDTMPDDANDFHYSYEEAQHELSRFLENFIS